LKIIKDLVIHYFYDSLMNVYPDWLELYSINRIRLKQKPWRQDLYRTTNL